MNKNGEQGSFSIGTVCQRTGINPVTLRAWERRYGLLRPQRTAKGRRLYSEADIRRVERILALLDEGIAVSQVGRILDQQNAGGAREPAAPNLIWKSYLDQILSAVRVFDEQALERAYQDALAVFPVDLTTRNLIIPALKQLGERWEEGTGTVAEEHFFNVFIRNKVGARIHHQARNATGARVVAACMPGEQHELGLLLFGLYAAERNYRVVLLGADTPLADLPTVVSRCNARWVALAANYAVEGSVLRTDLAALVRALQVPVFVGGRQAAAEERSITRAGAHCLGDDLDQALVRIEAAMRQLRSRESGSNGQP